VYPDEVINPGFTWPTIDPGYPFRNDRIDFIYAGGPFSKSAMQEKIKSCEIVVTPSDHYAILASIDL
jgi:endonuclease/exonuclease/phosphatase family metal-dependent hydrolase